MLTEESKAQSNKGNKSRKEVIKTDKKVFTKFHFWSERIKMLRKFKQLSQKRNSENTVLRRDQLRCAADYTHGIQFK